MAGLDPEVVRGNLARIREEIGERPQILAAVKYLDADDLPALREAGVTLVGENRAQQLEAKASAHPEFTWHFIGQLQSRKVKQILPFVELVHSVASESALAQLAKHGDPDTTRILVQVNIAADPAKDGVDPDDLPAFLEQARAVARVEGLMTMPPAAGRPEDSRRWFAALRELGAAHGLSELSMGTSQDYAVAAQEGATIVRVGSTLFGR